MYLLDAGATGDKKSCNDTWVLFLKVNLSFDNSMLYKVH